MIKSKTFWDQCIPIGVFTIENSGRNTLVPKSCGFLSFAEILDMFQSRYLLFVSTVHIHNMDTLQLFRCTYFDILTQSSLIFSNHSQEIYVKINIPHCCVDMNKLKNQETTMTVWIHVCSMIIQHQVALEEPPHCNNECESTTRGGSTICSVNLQHQVALPCFAYSVGLGDHGNQPVF